MSTLILTENYEQNDESLRNLYAPSI